MIIGGGGRSDVLLAAEEVESKGTTGEENGIYCAYVVTFLIPGAGWGS